MISGINLRNKSLLSLFIFIKFSSLGVQSTVCSFHLAFYLNKAVFTMVTVAALCFQRNTESHTNTVHNVTQYKKKSKTFEGLHFSPVSLATTRHGVPHTCPCAWIDTLHNDKGPLL